jgi:integrase
VTVAYRVLRLERAARALAPDRDWRWLRTLVNKLFLRARPVRDRRVRLRPASAVAAAGHAMMAEAEAGKGFTSEKKRAAAFRDGLLLALLAAQPLRVANMSALEIGRHLRRVGQGWTLRSEGGETKNGEPHEAPLPEELVAPLERYLARWRPVLLGPGGAASARLWISAHGRPLGPDTLHQVVTRAVERRLGVRINPHLLRAGLATELAIEDPEHVGAASALLGHQPGGAATTRHYNLAQQHEAARRWQEHVAALRRKARRGRSGG